MTVFYRLLIDISFCESSQEVVGRASSYVGLSTTGGWVEDQEIVIHLLVNFHYSCFVSAPIAVIGRRENSHHLLFVTPVVALKYQI